MVEVFFFKLGQMIKYQMNCEHMVESCIKQITPYRILMSPVASFTNMY